MREIWAADCETDPFDGVTIVQPFIWGALNVETREYQTFHTTSDFVDFFRDRVCVVYAHNGGKFDWHFLLPYFEPEQRLMVIAGRIAKFKIGECEFRDSFNIMPMPLSAVAKDEFDYEILKKGERDKPHNRVAIENYLRSDCVHLADMLVSFIAEFGFHLTQAGASVKAWEKISKEKAPETDSEFFNTIAPYYFGGRVEVFEQGEINDEFTIIDLNSAYPDAMMRLHPWGNTITVGDELPNSRGAIERSFITLKGPSLGALPWREKRGASLSFPADGESREFMCTGWEFFSAKETGCLPYFDILEVVTLANCMHFREYLNYFYQMKTDAKKAGDKARYEFSKRFLNSLYGKMGANPEEYEEYKTIEPCYIEAAEMDGYEFRAEVGKLAMVGRPLSEERRRYYNVATAASITGYVRAAWWRAARQCSGVIYGDTDCIFARKIGQEIELHPEKLGAWDIEAVCKYGAIAGKKLYAVETKEGKWKKASKGVKLTEKEIIAVARGATITHNPIAPTFSISRGIKFNPRKIQMR